MANKLKSILSLGIISIGSINYSNAGYFDPIIQGFNNITSFFTQVWGYLTDFLGFLWDLISGIYYSFNTIISYMAELFSDISSLSFFSDNSFVFQGLSSFLGSDNFSIFGIVFFLCMVIIVVRFIFSLIPFFHSKK